MEAYFFYKSCFTAIGMLCKYIDVKLEEFLNCDADRLDLSEVRS